LLKIFLVEMAKRITKDMANELLLYVKSLDCKVGRDCVLVVVDVGIWPKICFDYFWLGIGGGEVSGLIWWLRCTNRVENRFGNAYWWCTDVCYGSKGGRSI
jgi:hypothetical protein